jgi:hypothetical protein
MAAVRVLISQGSRNILLDWEEDDPSRLSQEDWKKSSTLWPQKWIDNPSDPPERPRVFLCLDEESLAQGYDHDDLLARLINEAGPHMWGAEIYVLLHNETALINPIAEPLQIPRPAPQEMFKLLLEKGVEDVLHWPSYAPNIGVAAQRSAHRMAQIMIPDPGKSWKCYLHTPHLGPQQGALLEPFPIRTFDELVNENCLIVLPENRDPDQYMKLLNNLHRINFPGAVMIGVIEQMGQLPLDVREFCRKHDYELVWFHGLVELYYFLLNLDRASKTNSQTDVVRTSVREQTFKSHRPKLLVTHSYSPDAEDDCVAAARDSWELTRELEDAAEVIIVPAVHVFRLADVMDNLQEVFAWVHIGHGREDGLRQSSDDLYKSAETWLSAFGGSSLPLVVFSSCKSAPVAELFAAAGTGVAIGFIDNLGQDQAAALTKRLVKTALIWAGSKDRILTEFSKRRKLITGTRPVAYWSR